ncbi:uncharacterized membrane protein YgdD (TMEM256/DUF423 family) [Rhodoligotrophos appendicifer]|uniref:DUF423 domain-containing protein n=1 Tax=Rhodoligotrophos appendicifer TaxID=987056 RepID=UPI001184E1C1|nr:DUF423 domain-containing protein [Rhodoligotrophos appendicifer]
MVADRVLIALGGLSGAGGVLLSAMAAHVGGVHLDMVSNFLLFHAAALMVIGLMARTPLMRIGGWVLVIGLLLFGGDMLARDFLGDRLFPMAAPAGGVALILGWLIVAGAAFLISGQEASRD